VEPSEMMLAVNFCLDRATKPHPMRLLAI